MTRSADLFANHHGAAPLTLANLNEALRGFAVMAPPSKLAIPPELVAEWQRLERRDRERLRRLRRYRHAHKVRRSGRP